MAYDPQNPLDAITGERAKRGKKDQSTFADRNKIKVGGPAGRPMEVQGKREPSGLMSVSYDDLAKAAEQQRTPGAVSMPPAPAKTSPQQPSQPKLPPPGMVSAPQIAKKEPVPQVGPPPARPRMDTSDAMFGDTGLQTVGQAMRQAPPPERGLTREMNEQILRDVLAGEAQRLRQVGREDEAMRRAFPDVSFRPRQQATESAIPRPTTGERQEGFVGPERQSAGSRADQLRAQIASEQQAMLAARRARGGSFREDTAPLERIAGMRQELAQYEKAATPGQPIRVKTPEENLATEQSLARQASDIMSKDVEDLRAQVASMPAGPERDAQAERLRSLEFQQQQQAARAGALPAGAVGPQPMGASAELAEQMMGEARARTERQREAAPRVATRQQELADVAMREGERLTGKRQDVEESQKRIREATEKATLFEIGKQEREFGMKEKGLDAQLRNIESQINERDASSRLAEIKTNSDINLQEREASFKEAALKISQDPNNPANQSAMAEASKKMAEAKLVEMQVERMRKKIEQGNKTPQEIQEEVAIENLSMERLGIPNLKKAAFEEGFKLASEIGGFSGAKYKGSMWTGNAEGGKKAVNVLYNYGQALTRLSQDSPELAKTLASELLAAMPASMNQLLSTTPSSMGLGLIGVGQMSNYRERESVVNMHNDFIKNMRSLAGNQQMAQ